MTGQRRRMPLGEHFFWAVIAAVSVMICVLVLAFNAQDNDPATIRQECVKGWDCNAADTTGR